jgi:hypothetical protein
VHAARHHRRTIDTRHGEHPTAAQAAREYAASLPRRRERSHYAKCPLLIL